ncbi:uncharacterized protein LOC122316121 [Carya illinoinensis]|uniref:uncharacterized protein LOC122316121 n=1 Tax=Carya illinoinensis TaxID=32201 RepID=UPI001C72549F|nr:uncharacterized protein LOC122316121 [Carya illinoinensis]
MNSTAKEIRGSLLYFNNAADIWNELKIRYLRSDGPRVFALEKSLSSISQGSSSITEYFSGFKALWDEYVSYRPLPTCNCGFMEKCTCSVFKNLADQQQVDYVMKFLIGLHNSFSAIRSQLLLLSPLPSMGKVFSLLIQEESQRSLTNAVHIPLDSHAMAAAQPFTQTSSNAVKFSKVIGKTDVICSHCGFSGHLVDKCFQLIGYPPGWKVPRGKRSNSTRLPNANFASSMEQNLNNPSMFFSQEQIQNLMTLANSLSISSINSNPAANTVSTSGNNPILYSANVSLNPISPWILDTGATDHMICSPHLFTFIKIPPRTSSIHLPNGHSVPIIFTGTVKYSPDLVLHNALYVPSFHFVTFELIIIPPTIYIVRLNLT